MVAASRAVLARMQRAGIASVTPAAGLSVLSTLLACRTPPTAQVRLHSVSIPSCVSGVCIDTNTAAGLAGYSLFLPAELPWHSSLYSICPRASVHTVRTFFLHQASC